MREGKGERGGREKWEGIKGGGDGWGRKGEGVASYPGPRVECGKGPGDNWQVFPYVLSQW